MQRFSVVVPRADGGVEVFAMKEWLRRNPEPGLDPNTMNSRQIGNTLRKRGWEVQESENEFRLIRPGVQEGGAAQAAAVLGETSDDTAGDVDSTSFGLEAQLRDFIAANLAHIPIN